MKDSKLDANQVFRIDSNDKIGRFGLEDPAFREICPGRNELVKDFSLLYRLVFHSVKIAVVALTARRMFGFLAGKEPGTKDF